MDEDENDEDDEEKGGEEWGQVETQTVELCPRKKLMQMRGGAVQLTRAPRHP
jgi:hypothetical protein